jgi:hypothetical protein
MIAASRHMADQPLIDSAFAAFSRFFATLNEHIIAPERDSTQSKAPSDRLDSA